MNRRHIGQRRLGVGPIGNRSARKGFPRIAKRLRHILAALAGIGRLQVHHPGFPAQPGEIDSHPLDAVGRIAHSHAVGDIVFIGAIGEVGPVADAGIADPELRARCRQIGYHQLGRDAHAVGMFGAVILARLVVDNDVIDQVLGEKRQLRRRFPEQIGAPEAVHLHSVVALFDIDQPEGIEIGHLPGAVDRAVDRCFGKAELQIRQQRHVKALDRPETAVQPSGGVGLRIDAQHIVEPAGVERKTETPAFELHAGGIVRIGMVRQDQAGFSRQTPIAAEAADKKPGALVAKRQIAGLDAAVDPLAGVAEIVGIALEVLIDGGAMRQRRPRGCEPALQLGAVFGPLVVFGRQAAIGQAAAEVAVTDALVFCTALVVGGDLLHEQAQPVLLPGRHAAMDAVDGGPLHLEGRIGLGEDKGHLQAAGLNGIIDIGPERGRIEPGGSLRMSLCSGKKQKNEGEQQMLFHGCLVLMLEQQQPWNTGKMVIQGQQRPAMAQ